MIKSILDTDLYKFSTSYAYFHLYPLAEGRFRFIDRNKESWKGQEEKFLKAFEDQMNILSGMHLTECEKNWCIKNIPYIPATYWEWLSTFRFDPSKMEYWIDNNGVFQCHVVDSLYKVTLYEIAVLATYSELRNKFMGVINTDNYEDVLNGVKDLTMRKSEKANFNQLNFSEFGTRRRFNSTVQKHVLETIKNNCETCVGTSNVMYAMQYDMKPIGTFPHEWIMFHGACFGYKRANYLGLEDWITTYKGDLGITLVDTYTTKSFLRTLTKQQALLLQGFRQDSGDELEVGNMIIKRLKELGIDPTTKTIVFSNALDFDKAVTIKNYFEGKCKISFGIGTNLTCDIPVDGYKPANVVMKLDMCRLSKKDPWEDCIKISDDLGKHMGNETEFKIAQYELKLG